MFRRDVLKTMPPWAATTSAAATAAATSRRAAAQTQADTLRIIVGTGQNSLDPHGFTVNPATLGLARMTHDRLFSLAQPDTPTSNYDNPEILPELAERWSQASDGLSITIRLRDGAIFHDGAPVTTADVKWSLDRAIANPAPANALRPGGIEHPEQLVILDPKTLRLDLAARNPTAPAYLAIPQASILNAALCRRHATQNDPWALAWVRTNPAGGGAYRVDTWSPATETVLVRHDPWLSGPQPYFRRVVIREVLSPSNRRAMLLRNEADLVPDLPLQDVADLSTNPALAFPGAPIPNTLHALGMNTQAAPFDDVRLRQAIAAIIPYQAILDTALLGRGRPLWNAAPTPNQTSPAWPRPFPYQTDLPRARALMQAAGLPDGFETTLSYDLANATVDEPVAQLIQAALKTLNLATTIDRRPSGTLPDLIGKRALPLFLFQHGTLLDPIESTFALLYPPPAPRQPQPAMTRLITLARAAAHPAAQDAARRQIIALAIRDVPCAPLVQPLPNTVTQRGIQGFVTTLDHQVDARHLSRSA